MGAWGTGLYQDDTACDVKESIKDRLIYGDEEGKRYTKEELIESILEEYEDYMQLDDDRAIVILVLADILWKNGMLTDNLKMEALKIIENKTDLERWGEDKELYKKREKVLEALKIKIESNQPEEKIIKIKRRPKPYICPWKVGDRFAYELKSEKAKEYGLEGRFLIISFERAMEWGDRDNKYYIPVMHIQITEDNKIPSTYEEIEKDVLAADAEDFRWSLHAQGDGAVGKITEIYQKCKKVQGKLKNRHAITDMEFTDPKDLEILGRIGVTAELYFQIMSLDPADVLINNIKQTIGTERGKYYWNRRKMQDSGMNLSGATDLPLLLTSIPESIYYSCGGYMDGRAEAFQSENTLTVPELLKAWTIGGQKNLGMEEVLGTLEEGKLADITVFDRNLLEINPVDARDARVVMTIMDGRTVFTENSQTEKN